MLAKRIALTLLQRGHQLVKGRQFKSWRTVGHALQAVKIYQSRGIDELIFLDINATPSRRRPNFDLIEQLTEECFMPIAVGGGVRDMEDIHSLMNCGADKVVVCTAAIENPRFIGNATDRWGSQAIVACIDVKDGKVSSHCGSSTHDLDPVDWARTLVDLGVGEIMVNSVDRDGMMEGYDTELLKRICDAVSVPVIASGGCGSYEHMKQAIDAGAEAVAAGAMYQFTDQTPKEAAQFLKREGIEVRL